jgi:hypothetical protein
MHRVCRHQGDPQAAGASRDEVNEEGAPLVFKTGDLIPAQSKPSGALPDSVR